jgi:hypothetical protein
MADEIYMSPNGFKCVRAQLAKTEGLDPVEYELAKKGYTDKSKLKVKAAEFVQ